jgi:hypothetical protein
MMGSMMRRAMLGDGSTLNLDFTTMTATADLTARGLTFTRGSTGTRINASGFVETMSNNVARFDHDPTTTPPTPRGLLIEGSATNLALRSGDFNNTVTDGTSWSAAGYTAGTLSTTLPDGTTGNARRISTASGSGSFRSATITVTASTAYTFSFWARNNGGSQARFRVWNVTAGSSIVDYTQSVNNYVSQIGGANNTSSTWVRVSVSFTTPAGCTAIYVYPTSSDSGTVDLLVWGAQVEAGSASSYIPTVASQATRNADDCELLDLSTIAFNASAGTIYTDVGTRLNTGNQRNYTFLPASGANNQIFEGSYTALNVYSSGSFVAQIGTSAIAAQKIAAAYAVNDYAVSVAGGAVATDTSGALPSSLTKLTIGGSIINSAAYMNGCIRVFKYWPTRLTNAQLQSLTT